MRILIHGINYAPELTGIGKYTGEMATWLAAAGHEVRIVTAPPYYPAWEVQPGYRADRYCVEALAGVTVFRCPCWVPKRPSAIRRLAHLLSFALSAAPVMIGQVAWRPNLVIVIEPPLFCAPTAWLVAKLSRAISWLHIQDFEIDAAFQLGILTWRPLHRLVSGVERRMMRAFDFVSTISSSMVERLRQKGVAAAKCFLFPNWVDTELICPDSAGTEELRAELGLPSNRIICLYSGNLGEKQGLDILIRVAVNLRHRSDIQFVICGDGGTKERLIEQAIGVDGVLFRPLQPLNKLNALLNLADLHLLPQRANAADLVMPSKLTGILAAGGAVIATAPSRTELANVVEAAGGRVVEPDDDRALERVIVALAENPEERHVMRQRARQYALMHLEKEAIFHKLMERFQPGTDELEAEYDDTRRRSFR